MICFTTLSFHFDIPIICSDISECECWNQLLDIGSSIEHLWYQKRKIRFRGKSHYYYVISILVSKQWIHCNEKNLCNENSLQWKGIIHCNENELKIHAIFCIFCEIWCKIVQFKQFYCSNWFGCTPTSIASEQAFSIATDFIPIKQLMT